MQCITQRVLLQTLLVAKITYSDTKYRVPNHFMEI